MIKNRLVLIDSFALIFRAYYGIPPSLTRDGHPINAAYGFASAILAAIKELQPEYLVACFDLPKPTKRHIEYIDYKATRKPMPDDLVPQIQYCKKILEVMNIPLVSAEGYEGEDIIATIIYQLQQKGVETENIIVTGDSDTFQLVDGYTRVYSMARGAAQAVMYDESKVKERYGLPASNFVDFKALKGDTSDNIPGVPGIGEKTAAKLIQDYQSLEKIYENIEKIKGKVQTLLTENKDQAFLSRKLSQIVSDAPIEFDLASSRIHDFDKVKVEKLFLELGFKSLIARMPVSTRTNNQQALF
jgi:DNA polymerase-1